MAFKYLFALVPLITFVQAASPVITCSDGNTASNVACCPLFALRDSLQANLFDNQCGEETHEVLRLAFNDAISFSQALKNQGEPAGGGADGSMILFPNVETNFAANIGTADSVDFLTPFLAANPQVTAGDLIQFAAAVGISNCPGAPRLQFLSGRPNATAPAPNGLVPVADDDVTTILARMADGGNFSPDEVVALLSSHSIARADHIDPTISAAPFDTTPFTFDTQFFLEVLLTGIGFPGIADNSGEVESPLPIAGEIRLQSDFAIARDSRTACTWQGFVNEQQKMSDAFQAAMAKAAVIGQDTKTLIDCSEVVPVPVPASGKPASFPATKTQADIQQVCPSPFPTLSTDPGATETAIPPLP